MTYRLTSIFFVNPDFTQEKKFKTNLLSSHFEISIQEKIGRKIFSKKFSNFKNIWDGLFGLFKPLRFKKINILKIEGLLIKYNFRRNFVSFQNFKMQKAFFWTSAPVWIRVIDFLTLVQENVEIVFTFSNTCAKTSFL